MRALLREIWSSFTPWFRSFGNIGLATEQYTEWGYNEAKCFNQSGQIEQAATLKRIEAELNPEPSATT